MRIKIAAIVVGFGLASAVHAQDRNWSVYGGADFVATEVSVTRTLPPDESVGATLGSTERIDNDADMIRLKVGLWLNEDFAVEVQGSVSSDDVEAPDTGEIDSYYGAFILPRAQPFDWLDMMFPVGFAATDTVVVAENGDRVATSNTGIAYGINFQFRLGELLTDPDSIVAGLGISAGFLVYDSSDDTNVRGYNAGLQFGYDF